MSRDLVLVAAGGLAREVIEATRAAGRHDVVALLDDDVRRHGQRALDVPVLGGPDLLGRLGDVDVLICAGRGSTRRCLRDRLALPEDRYASVVHPDASVAASCHVAAGSIVLAGAVLTASVTLGRHVVVMPHVTCTHDDRIEDFATLCAGVSLGGGVEVGAGAYLGMQAGVRENVRIGRDAVVGMGAVVLCDVPPAQTWTGVPARVRRTGREQDRATA